MVNSYPKGNSQLPPLTIHRHPPQLISEPWVKVTNFPDKKKKKKSRKKKIKQSERVKNPSLSLPYLRVPEKHQALEHSTHTCPRGGDCRQGGQELGGQQGGFASCHLRPRAGVSFGNLPPQFKSLWSRSENSCRTAGWELNNQAQATGANPCSPHLLQHHWLPISRKSPAKQINIAGRC